MRKHVIVAVLLSAMLSTACGARFSDEERAVLINNLAGGQVQGAGEVTGTDTGAAVGTTGTTGTTGTGTTGTTGATGTTGTTGTAGTTGTTTTTNPGTTTTTTNPGTTANPGTTTNPGTGGQAPADDGSSAPAPSQAPAGPGQPAAPTDTRAAPAGGNGGATDTGVTETSITISQIADISGAVPGLFADTQKAVNAYIAKFTTEEGTVYGRQIQLINRDAKLDTNENRKQYLAACDDSLAAVGSMSAFEQGAATSIEGCGIIDLRTAAVNPTMQAVKQVVSTDAMLPDQQPLSEYIYWKENFGEAYKHAAAIFINADTTKAQTGLVMRGTATIGYEWIDPIQVELTETNYAPIVIKLKDNNIEFVFFQGAYQQAARLAQAMRQQQYTPVVYALQSNAYTPDLITSGGADVEGIQIAVPSALVSEINQYPELAEYDKWLKQIDPNASPTSLGMYAWASAKLFVQALKDIGPEITRVKLLAYLDGVSGYDGGGLIPPQEIGSQKPADCVTVIAIEGGQFVRKESPQPGTFRCGPGAVKA